MSMDRAMEADVTSREATLENACTSGSLMQWNSAVRREGQALRGMSTAPYAATTWAAVCATTSVCDLIACRKHTLI